MVSKRWTWLAGLAVLFAGLTNAHNHVHYCFDGQEPLAAVHLADDVEHAHETSGDHAGHHDGDADHDDLDVDVPSKALAKSLKHELPAIASVFVSTTALEPGAGNQLPDLLATLPGPEPPYARPPSRAPPG